MTHLSPDRLAELARSAGAPLTTSTADEREHLATCDECRAGRRRDEAVDRALRSIPWPVPSASFVAATQARFLAARRAQEIRSRLRVAVASAATMAVVATATVLMGLIAMKQVVLFLAMRLKGVVVAVDLAQKLAGRSALTPILVSLACAACLALSMGVIARLARAPAQLE